jgi:hypothetical protein
MDLVLGSFLGAAAAVVGGFFLSIWGWDCWYDGRLVTGGIVLFVATSLAVSGTAGLLVGLDPLSLLGLLGW